MCAANSRKGNQSIEQLAPCSPPNSACFRLSSWITTHRQLDKLTRPQNARSIGASSLSLTDAALYLKKSFGTEFWKMDLS